MCATIITSPYFVQWEIIFFVLFSILTVLVIQSYVSMYLDIRRLFWKLPWKVEQTSLIKCQALACLQILNLSAFVCL